MLGMGLKLGGVGVYLAEVSHNSSMVLKQASRGHGDILRPRRYNTVHMKYIYVWISCFAKYLFFFWPILLLNCLSYLTVETRCIF